LLRVDGFQFFFYANEHEPEHIHIQKTGKFAKINLRKLEVVSNYLKPRDFKKALQITRENQEQFLEEWHEFFNKR